MNSSIKIFYEFQRFLTIRFWLFSQSLLKLSGFERYLQTKVFSHGYKSLQNMPRPANNHILSAELIGEDEFRHHISFVHYSEISTIVSLKSRLEKFAILEKNPASRLDRRGRQREDYHLYLLPRR